MFVVSKTEWIFFKGPFIIHETAFFHSSHCYQTQACESTIKGKITTANSWQKITSLNNHSLTSELEPLESHCLMLKTSVTVIVSRGGVTVHGDHLIHVTEAQGGTSRPRLPSERGLLLSLQEGPDGAGALEVTMQKAEPNSLLMPAKN